MPHPIILAADKSELCTAACSIKIFRNSMGNRRPMTVILESPDIHLTTALAMELNRFVQALIAKRVR